MPPLPRIRASALDDLVKQLRYAPGATLRRHIERAEWLAGRIDPDEIYPEDWVVHQVTGYRPSMDEPALLVGEALRADLPAFVEHLCEAARLTPSDAPEAVSAEALASQWNVTRRTLERWRRLGLVGRRVAGESRARAVLVFMPEAVRAFEAREGERIARARSFTRLDAADEQEILELARGDAERGVTLNRAARRAAARTGRSHEGVRQFLRRAAGDGLVEFAGTAPLSTSRRRMIARAARWGVAASRVGEATGRSVASVHRVIAEERARALRGFEIPALPRHADPGSLDAHLATPEAQGGLLVWTETDLLAFLHRARVREAPDEQIERARGRALVAARERARRTILELPVHSPALRWIDRAETDLRWSSRLKAVLLAGTMPVVIQSFAGAVDREPESLRAGLLVEGLAVATAAASSAIDRYDAWGGGRVAGAVTLAVSRACAAWARVALPSAARGGQASPRLLPGHSIAHWASGLDAWQTDLDLTGGAQGVMLRLADEHRAWLACRHGLGGQAPRTLEEAATEFGHSRAQAGRREREALAAVRVAVCLEGRSARVSD